MADEHVLQVRSTIPKSLTVADATGIEKGAVLKIADPSTVSGTTALNDLVGGILAYEKIASDGVTMAAVYRGPGDVFKGTASGAISQNDPLGLVGADGAPNRLRSVLNVGTLSGARIIGFSNETAADGETFEWTLNIQSGPGA